jgi:GT2 family glycosyltransferase
VTSGTEKPAGRIATATCDAIIVNYNAGASLRRAVSSALDEGAARVIVVDNGSRDDSLVAVRRDVDRRMVTIVEVGRNAGFAAACNIGIGQSEAPHLLFLNPDCTLGGGALTQLQAVLESEASIGMVGGRLCDPDGREQRGGRRRFPTPRLAWDQIAARLRPKRTGQGFLQHEEPLPERPVDVEAISGACMLVKREAVSAAGAWDEGYFLHCEDLDWCRQFAARGWRVVFVPDALVYHEKGVSSRSRPIFVEWHKHRGMLRFYRKWQSRQYSWATSMLVAAGIWTRFAVVAAGHAVMSLFRRRGGHV